MTALDNAAANHEPVDDPCIRGNCGEPRESPVHDDESEMFEHSYLDDGAPDA